MTYLTNSHQPVPAHIAHGGRLIPTALLIARGDDARLAQIGVYPHITTEDPAPLGYTEWMLVDGAYRREPAGTPEEVQAALDAQAVAEIASTRAQLHARRQAARLSAQTSGFVHDGHVHASDRDESVPLLTNAALAAQLAIWQGAEAVADFNAALGAGWRSTDGIPRITTAAGIVALHAAFVAHGAACDRHSEALKALINAAETLADFADVAAEIDVGWPEAVPT